MRAAISSREAARDLHAFLESDAGGRAEHGHDPATAFTAHGPLEAGLQRRRCPQGECHHHGLTVREAVGRALVTGLISRACPKQICPRRKRGVVDPRDEAAAAFWVASVCQMPDPSGPDLDRAVGDARHLIAHANGDLRRVGGIDWLERELRRLWVVAQCHRNRRVVLGLVACSVLPPKRELPFAWPWHRQGKARYVRLGLRRAAAALAPGGAELVCHRSDRRAVDLNRIRPNRGPVVSVAPRFTALDADIDARGRRVVDSRGDGARDAARFPALSCASTASWCVPSGSRAVTISICPGPFGHGSGSANGPVGDGEHARRGCATHALRRRSTLSRPCTPTLSDAV